MLNTFLKIYFIFLITITLYQPVYSAQNNMSGLNTLEAQFFNHNFLNEPVANRLDRVERVIFGRTYSENEDKRLGRLAAFASNPKQSVKEQTNSSQAPTGFAADPAAINTKDDSATDYPVITMLESSAFQREFKGENVYLRLNRLESKVFGTTFPQDSLYNRVEKLKSALNQTRPDEYRTAKSSMNNTSIFANLSSLELTIFNKTFDGEAVANRLARLESKVFGSVQSGVSEIRLSKLNQNIENSFAASAPNANSYTNLGGMNENYSSNSTPLNPTGANPTVWDVVKSVLFSFLTGSSGYGNYGGYGGYGSNYYGPVTSGYSSYDPFNPYSSLNRSTNNSMGAGVRILP